MNHHFCVETIARADRTLMFLNLLLLLTVSFLPFPTRLVAEYLQKPGEQTAVYRVRSDLRRDGDHLQPLVALREHAAAA